ncbi:hypothetical protein MN116_002011 [Schistosoma mekongi]|uniref:Complex I-B14.7 n=1 Tax=Schistosoma mekongi TaxID=38744 RepID=A0AAE1ZJ95_SCHME|nr:hypothetical protein MN116_002011 [Schistosoma mekongi]
MKYTYNYLTSVDDKYPMFRMKMAFMAAYGYSFLASSLAIINAFGVGTSLTQAGMKCTKYVLTGTAAGLGHSSASFISAKTTGRSDNWLNHAVGGAVSGLICAWKYPVGIRTAACVGFAIVSTIGKCYVQSKEKYPDWRVPVVGERYPAPYASLNHRWMNKYSRQQEEELEKHI